jgi:hypothetical protein
LLIAPRSEAAHNAFKASNDGAERQSRVEEDESIAGCGARADIADFSTVWRQLFHLALQKIIAAQQRYP